MTTLHLFQHTTLSLVYLKSTNAFQQQKKQKKYGKNLTNYSIYSKDKLFSPVSSRKDKRGRELGDGEGHTLKYITYEGVHEPGLTHWHCPFSSFFTEIIFNSLANIYTLEVTVNKCGALQANLCLSFLSMSWFLLQDHNLCRWFLVSNTTFKAFCSA